MASELEAAPEKGLLIRPPLRLTLVISALTAGGAERVLTTLAERWVAAGHAVTIVDFSPPDVEPFFALPDGVVERRLGLLRESRNVLHAIGSNVGRIRRLRAAIRESRPDVVIAFINRTSILTILASRGLGIPVIVAERTDPRAGDLGRAWAPLRAVIYPLAARVVVQTGTARAAFPTWIRRRTTIIPNPLTPGAAGERPFDARESIVVGLGRLHRAKGFDLLIRAFADIAAAHPAWRLSIWGEGPERASLERLRSELRLDDRVDLPGNTGQPLDELGRAGIFVLSSRVEGFPNALIEAMAGGAPVIATDCRSGPAEIVHDGVDGVLVPTEDVPALAAAMDRLMTDAAARRALGERATDIGAQLDAGAIVGRWDALIGVVRRSRPKASTA